MSVMLAIGDFSQMTHLSVKALRHYHEIGLLEPAAVDGETGYRSYDPSQIATAQVIRRFRDLGMPLDQVKAVIEAPDLAARNEAVVAHLATMERQLDHTQAMVASLRVLLEGPPTPGAVEFRSVPRTPTLAIRETVSMDEVEPWCEAAFAELYGALRTAGIAAAGCGGALYHGELFELELGEVVAFVPVTDRPDAERRTDAEPRTVPFDVPGAELAVMLHRGRFSDLDQTYGALGTYVAERAIAVDGPIREHYLVTPADTDDESQYRTEVCWPVFQTTGGADR
jgi:DNA-binding transcriptional MerR regulator